MGRESQITEPLVGGPKTDVDGMSLTAGASAMAEAVFTMPEALHVQGAYVVWEGMQEGDYAWVAVTHPASAGNLGALAVSGQASVTVGAGLGPYYNPLIGAKYLEVWNLLGAIQEVRRIASVAGDVVILESNLDGTYDTTHATRARYDGFSPVRGARGIDGGARLLGSNSFLLRNELAVTELIPTGLLLSGRLKTTAALGTRKLALNFFFRKPFVV